MPLAEVQKIAKNAIVFIQADIDVISSGTLISRIEPAGGAIVWIDGQQQTLRDGLCPLMLEQGRRVLTLRIDTSTFTDATLRVGLEKPPGSTVEFSLIGAP
jgi:hypothetical protein